MICLRSFAWQSTKQIPVASSGISSYDAKIVTGANVLVRDSSRDNYYIASLHFDVLAVLAAESKICCARINTQHFVRTAVIMRKAVDSVSPRIGPVILREKFFESRR
jgi:hypothetical protein